MRMTKLTISDYRALQVDPLLRLSFAYKVKEHSGVEAPFLVEGVGSGLRVSTRRGQVVLDGHLKRLLVCLSHACRPKTNRARSRRSISNGVMHLMRRPMQTLGIFIFFVVLDAISWVTRV